MSFLRESLQGISPSPSEPILEFLRFLVQVVEYGSIQYQLLSILEKPVSLSMIA